MSQRVGPYVLLEELGRGGMGAVYRARSDDGGPDVALKLLDAGGPLDPGERQRFVREVRSMLSLRHPRIVAVRDAGVDGAGRPFLVMDLVAGETLAAKLAREGPLADDVARRLARGLAEALAAVHAAGLVHRDVKPQNVLLDADGEPLLTDFGLAVAPHRDTRLTQTGEVLGTPAYMAPEQASGERSAVGPATDVYGLGATLYHMLTGRPPFAGKGVIQLLHEVLTSAPPAPSTLRPGVDRGLAVLCLRCLAKAPGERFPSAEAVLRALDVAGRPRRRARLAASGLAAATLAVLLVAGLRSGAAPSPPRQEAARAPAPSLPPAPTPEQPPLAAPDDVPPLARVGAWGGGARAHAGRVMDVAWLDDGRLVSYGEEGVLRCWSDGAPVALPVSQVVALSPAAGGRVAFGHPDGSVGLWEPATGRAWRGEAQEGARHPIRAVAWAPRRGLLRAITAGGAFLCWELADEAEPALVFLDGAILAPWIVAADFSPDGEWLGLALVDRLELHRAVERIEWEPVARREARVERVVVAPGGGSVGVVSPTHGLAIWRPGQPVEWKPGPGRPTKGLALAPDGERLLAVGAEGLVARPPEGEVVRILNHPGLGPVAARADGTLAVGVGHAVLTLAPEPDRAVPSDLATGEIAALCAVGDGVLACAADGRVLLRAAHGEVLDAALLEAPVLRAASGLRRALALVCLVPGPDGFAADLRFVADPRQVLDLPRGVPEADATPARGALHSLEWLSERDVLLAGPGWASVYRLIPGQDQAIVLPRIARFPLDAAAVTTVTGWAEDDEDVVLVHDRLEGGIGVQRLAVAPPLGTSIPLQVAERSRFGPERLRVWRLVALADRRSVLVAAEDGSLDVWDVETGRRRLRLLPPGGHFVQHLIRAGRLVAWATAAPTVTVWDAEEERFLGSADLSHDPEGRPLHDAVTALALVPERPSLLVGTARALVYELAIPPLTAAPDGAAAPRGPGGR